VRAERELRAADEALEAINVFVELLDVDLARHLLSQHPERALEPREAVDARRPAAKLRARPRAAGVTSGGGTEGSG
tara:strand:- start:627 stop:854 length:228 start_codon:yes stop_codon:yes gene_type:complete